MIVIPWLKMFSPEDKQEHENEIKEIIKELAQLYKIDEGYKVKDMDLELINSIEKYMKST